MSETSPTEPGLPILIDPRELPGRTWVQLVRAVHRVGRRLEALLDAHGLSVAQFDVLANLEFGAGITQQELAGRLLVTKGNVCGLLDRMGAAGLVERRADPDDRRVNRVHLTDRGRTLLAETLPEHHALVGRVLGTLGPGEVEGLHGLLRRVNAAIEID